MATLRPFVETDLNYLNAWIDNPEVALLWTGRAIALPISAAQIEEFHSASESVTALMIIATNGAPIGYLETHLKEEQSMHLARILLGNKNFRGKGLMQLVLKSLADELFNNTPTRRMTLNVFAENQAAYRCYRKVGFMEYLREANYQNSGKTMVAMQLYKPVPGLSD